MRENRMATVKLTTERFYEIMNGLDLRELLRMDGGFDLEHEKYIEVGAAIMLLAFKIFPLSLPADNIHEIINRLELDRLSDEEFDIEMQNAISAWRN